MNKQIVTLAIITSIFFAACSGDVPKQDKAATPKPSDTAMQEALADATIIQPLVASVDPKLSAQVQSIYNAYLQIKTALISGKSKEAASSATATNNLTKEFDVTGIPLDQIKAYQMHSAAILETSANIAGTQDIKVQRDYFSVLSQHIFELMKNYGADKTIYQEHCPMAFDGKGAFWLSDEVNIRNPYFGDEMLECGEVTNVIKK
ncbi:hypothetical protein CJD36_019140 [Flavipsychrobacter stenotrophus]|uniref:DUF3347 domain-containing protein n=1 Tax=Flavipsychrobacter stenotrophus TaxID=2077091 RepID=A0A2S7SRJ6_9BACT|nr:DUF3347 domain-containing protein [Flavipsychrobacter stenotrophus]PQJ09364.1 hypothetical protein CJD36_019140 [Flavipsychrobacter stenotrophus]